MPEAPMEKTENGHKPTGPGWYILNAADSRWTTHDKFGVSNRFEGERWPHLGLHLHILEPGQPACYYHRESMQEGFLVLSGEALVVIEGEERPLRAWDYVHCPAGTDHVFVGAGSGPCTILMIGARDPEMSLHYPVHEVPGKYGACAAQPTDNPREAYADITRPRPLPEAPWPPA